MEDRLAVIMKINLRWYDENDRKLMLDGVDRINKSIAAAYNLPSDLYPTTVTKGSSKVLSNDAEMAETLQPVLRSFLSEKAVIAAFPKLMGSEDFHHLVLDNKKHRYLFLNVGTAKPADVKKARAEGKAVPYSNHNPDFRVNLAAIPLEDISILTNREEDLALIVKAGKNCKNALSQE